MKTSIYQAKANLNYRLKNPNILIQNNKDYYLKNKDLITRKQRELYALKQELLKFMKICLE
jgi:hypothetical protein